MDSLSEFIYNWGPLVTFFIFVGAMVYIYFTGELE